MSHWVFNASPLILLGKIDQLEWLPRLQPSFVIPSAVVSEIEAGPTGDRAIAWLKRPEVRLRVSDRVTLVQEVAAWDLGAGETAVISAAIKTGAIAVLDDRAARNCAKVFSVPTLGTISILLKAKKLGIISRVGPLLDDLRTAGSFLSEAVTQEALRLAGED